MSYRPFESWDIYGSVGFAHTEFTQLESAVQGEMTGSFCGLGAARFAFGTATRRNRTRTGVDRVALRPWITGAGWRRRTLAARDQDRAARARERNLLNAETGGVCTPVINHEIPNMMHER